MDYSLPGSSVHGIFRARVLEWGAISFSRGSSDVPLKSSSLIPIMIYLSPKLYSHSCPLWPQSCAWVHGCLVTSVMSDSMHTCGLYVTRQAPLSVRLSRQEYGVGCHALLRGSSWPRDQTCISMSPALAGGFFTTSTTCNRVLTEH